MFAILELQDFAIIGLLVALLAGSSAYVKIRPSERAALRRLDRKLDAITKHLGIEMPAELHGLSVEVRQLLDEGKKLEACKLHKEEKGVSLMEAKKAVDVYTGR